MPQALPIIAAAGLALGLAQTGMALSKGAPKLPTVTPPPAPPPPPPPPQPLPPAPTETQADEAVTREARRRTRRFGLAQTVLASPLGTTPAAPEPPGRMVLGG